MVGAAEGASAGATAAGMVGVLDVVVIGGVAALALYWFVLRKKKEQFPEMKKLTVV